ncbi:MAG: DUF1667 domain-containing protein [Clostridia bacterium]|nr:DUF1667 domain-containing protein [Clostridia bacterium]
MKQMELTCICCPVGCVLRAEIEAGAVKSVSGNGCKRGAEYAAQECIAPVRVVTASVPVLGGSLKRVSVKTAAPVAKEKMFAVMEALRLVTAQAPVKIGDVLCPDIAGSGADLVATRGCDMI